MEMVKQRKMIVLKRVQSLILILWMKRRFDICRIVFFTQSIFIGTGALSTSPVQGPNQTINIVQGQDRPDVEPTWSDFMSVTFLLDDLSVYSGFTFIIPRSNQRLWNPPIGYACVYELWLHNDAKLWFPITRLITAHHQRRDIALSQLMTGSISVSMGVRIFEELFQVQWRWLYISMPRWNRI